MATAVECATVAPSTIHAPPPPPPPPAPPPPAAASSLAPSTPPQPAEEHSAKMLSPAGEAEQMEALLRWAAALGVTYSPPPRSAASCLGHSLSVTHFPDAGGRGLAAARELRRAETVLRVPTPPPPPPEVSQPL